MIEIWPRVPRPRNATEEALLRASLASPALARPQVSPARLHHITNQALRQLRTQRVVDPGFGWLLAPRVAALLLALGLAGGAAGLGLPATAAAPTTQATPGLTALLDQPLTLSTE